MRFLEELFCHRPRIFNLLHRIHLVRAISQTNSLELSALARFASGARLAVEIGSFQGVSAAVIARSLAENGVLHCVDPWPAKAGGSNAVFDIFNRHIRRARMANRIQIIRNFSANAADRMPDSLDFAFIDGDHSWNGIETDWAIVAGRIRDGGIVCLHDTAIPAQEPWRDFESCTFYDLKIHPNNNFELVDTVYSMRILRKR